MWPTEYLARHQCDRFANCAHERAGFSSFGTYSCTCWPGFVGSGFAGDCTDVEPPTVLCIPNLTVSTAPGQAFASVALGMFPDVTDNSVADVVMMMIKVNQSGVVSQSFAGTQIDFPLDSPSHIIYTARDDAGNEGTCVTDVLVDDAGFTAQLRQSLENAMTRGSRIVELTLYGHRPFLERIADGLCYLLLR